MAYIGMGQRKRVWSKEVNNLADDHDAQGVAHEEDGGAQDAHGNLLVARVDRIEDEKREKRHGLDDARALHVDPHGDGGRACGNVDDPVEEVRLEGVRERAHEPGYRRDALRHGCVAQGPVDAPVVVTIWSPRRPNLALMNW